MNYPNLELLEYMFEEHLHAHSIWKERFSELKAKNKWIRPEYRVYVFPQTWGSTATAFDQMEDGSPAFGGCAMTTVYTTVLHEINTEFYGVFVDGKACYMVYDPTEIFYEDFENRRMQTLSHAKKLY